MAEAISSSEGASAANESPLDAITLLELIGRIGTEDATVPYSKTGESEDAIAMNIVKGLFMPLKAIAECSSVETESDSGSDSDDDSYDGSHGDTPGGFRGPRVVSNPGPAISEEDLAPTYIFPPSPLLDLEEAEYKNDTDTADLSCTARVARYLDDYMGSGTVALLQKTARDADANIISTLPTAWADRFRRFHATIEPRYAYSIIARNDSKEGEDERHQLVTLFLTADPTDFVVRDYSGGGETIESTKHVVPANQALRQLLFLHARITWMLYRSKAGTLIDRLLADNSKTESLSSDGGTMADVFMELRLEGWYKKPARGRENNESGAGSPGIWIDHAQLVEEETH